MGGGRGMPVMTHKSHGQSEFAVMHNVVRAPGLDAPALIWSNIPTGQRRTMPATAQDHELLSLLQLCQEAEFELWTNAL